MKKLLVITYYWPPSGGAGVQRWLKFVRYLREFGWEPVVYCPENPEYPETDPSLGRDVPAGIEVLKHPIWEPYLLYKKLQGRKKEERISAAFLSEKKRNRFIEAISVWIRGNLFIPDARRFWIAPSVKFLLRYLETHPVDAIASTGPPHSTHLIAAGVAQKSGIPWLADFRDPWTNIDFYRDLRLTARADRRHRELEERVLRQADAVTVISRSMAEDFRRIVARDYTVITNGYDEADLSGPEPERDTKFSIAHIGTMVSTRNPETLWEALKQLLKELPELADDLEIKLVGRVDHTVTASLESYGLAGFVNRTEYLPHDRVTDCQRRSQVLLLLINNTPNAAMILTGKFFEYLAARRPVLCLGPVDGDAAQILKETGAGLISGFGDVALMKAHVSEFYRQYRDGTLGISSHGTEKYSRKELTRSLARVLDRISGREDHSSGFSG